jgi:hypothetical protein
MRQERSICSCSDTYQGSHQTGSAFPSVTLASQAWWSEQRDPPCCFWTTPKGSTNLCTLASSLGLDF